MRPWVAAGLLAAGCAFAQPERDVRDAVNWATGQASRFQSFTNPVMSAHALGRLAELTCAYDRNAAAGIYRQAISRINTIPPEIFFDTTISRLPVASFTRLWSTIAAGEKKCDAALGPSINNESFRRRQEDERRNAHNGVVLNALTLIGRDRNRQLQPVDTMVGVDLDRAAQLVELVLEAGDPAAIDFDGIGYFLSGLRDRAPDLSDDVFRKALVTVIEAPAPSTANLNTLGKYLFISPAQQHLPDDRYFSSALGDRLFDFRATRMSTNTEVVSAYIDSLLKLVERMNYDPAVAYGLAVQMIPHARDLELESEDALREWVPRLYTSGGAAMDALLAAAGSPIADEEMMRRNRRARDVMKAISREDFGEARRGVGNFGDAATARQLAPLVEFAESVAAMKEADLNRATRLANAVQPGGVKRGLLYAGIAAQAGPGIASAMAAGEIEDVTAEFQAALSSGLAGAVMSKDPERAYFSLAGAVAALNAARLNPRRARLDPRGQRGTGSAAGRPGDAANTDVVSVPLSTRRFYHVVDTGFQRFPVPLDVPGVATFTLPDVIRKAVTLDPQRIEGTVLDLRDETQRAEALVAIAELRLKVPQPVPESIPEAVEAQAEATRIP